MLGGRTRAALEREKTLVLRSIKDLEFDFAMKKMSQSDYDEMSARLRARAVGLMRQLDEGSGYRASIEAGARQTPRTPRPAAGRLQPASARSNAKPPTSTRWSAIGDAPPAVRPTTPTRDSASTAARG